MPTPQTSSLEERFQALACHGQWSAVQEVCARLKKDGFQALLAGGCVRDLLLGREPNDFDIATDATPDQVHAIYPHALTVGKAFGVTILPFEGFQIEVATFREDLEYHDGRRPSGVRFTGPEEDAKRRDFTVNALFYDPEKKCLLDFVGGEKDLAERVIRTVGRAEDRFTEDKLRLLRAVRFAAQLEFEIAPETLAAVTKLAPGVVAVSRERVRDEILKLLKVKHRRLGFTLGLSTGLFPALFPELCLLIDQDRERWLIRLAGLREDTPSSLGLAVFFSPLYRPGEESRLKHDHLKPLKLDNKQIDSIAFALQHKQDFLEPSRLREGELILLLSHPAARIARGLADLHEREEQTEQKVAARNLKLDELARKALGIDFKKPQPLVNGEALKAQGLKPGAEMGKILHEAYLLQLEGKIRTHDEGLSWLKSQVINSSSAK